MPTLKYLSFRPLANANDKQLSKRESEARTQMPHDPSRPVPPGLCCLAKLSQRLQEIV